MSSEPEGRIIPYDTETTGTGKIDGKGPSFQKPVGVFNVAYQESGGKITSLYGESKIPFEEGKFIDNMLRLNKPGIDASDLSEKQMLEKFMSKVKEGDTLMGWNSVSFDSPVVLQRLIDLGLDKEAAKMSKVKHLDLQLKVKGYMDRLIREETVVGLSDPRKDLWLYGVEKNPKGMSQGAIARGLGVKVTSAHVGKDDVKVLTEIAEYAKDYETFKKRMLLENKEGASGVLRWAKHVDVERREKNPHSLMTLYEDAFAVKPKPSPGQLAVNTSSIDAAAASNIADDPSSYTRNTSQLSPVSWGLEEREAIEEGSEEALEEGSRQASKKSARKPAQEAAKNIITDNLDEVADKGAKAFAAMQDVSTVKSIGVLGAVTVAALAVTNVRKYFRDKGNEVPEELRINARELGKPLYEIVNDLKGAGSTKKLNKQISAQYHTMGAGTAIGKQVADEMSDLPNFVGAEVELEDRFLGVKGFADTVMNIQGEHRPMELKTIDDVDFNRLTGPKAAHAMQANFYTHALGAEKGYVMYISREDPEKRVTFDVPYDPGSLIAAVEKYRGAVHSASQSGGYSTALEYFFGNKSGTRDQTNRSYLNTPGQRRTPNDPNNSYVGSRNIPRN
jgi:hypothetical protein